MVVPIDDIRPNYRQVESCLTCPHMKDLLKRGTALVCNKWESWTCESNTICDDHPAVTEIKTNIIEVDKHNVPKGYRLAKKKKRKNAKKKTAKKKPKTI